MFVVHRHYGATYFRFPGIAIDVWVFDVLNRNEYRNRVWLETIKEGETL